MALKRVKMQICGVKLIILVRVALDTDFAGYPVSGGYPIRLDIHEIIQNCNVYKLI